MTNRKAALSAMIFSLVLIGCSPRAPLDSPTVLPGPEAGAEAFEPSLAIDPTNPERIVVAAMYGNPSARGGRGIWTWESRDGGRVWAGARMTPPLVGAKPAGWAADVITGIDADGSTVLTSMAGARDPRTDGLGGIVVARRATADSSFADPVLVMRDRLLPNDRAFSYDKPWMAIDRGPGSRYRGSVYAISGVLELVLPAQAWAENPTDMSKLVMLGLDFAVSRDGGKTFGPLRRVADSVFGADMVVDQSGVLEVVYPKLSGGRSAIIHLRSRDGGISFEPPVEVVTGGQGGAVGGPIVATRNGTLMACWSETSAAEAGSNRLRCAERSGEGGWTAAAIDVPVPPATRLAFPTLVGTPKGWYLAVHLIAATATEVVLFRSAGRSDFKRLATLAVVPGLGLPQWCFARECRFFRDDLFMPGDYASLAASGGRLAAAYVLPRPGGSLFGRAAVHVSVMNEPE